MPWKLEIEVVEATKLPLSFRGSKPDPVVTITYVNHKVVHQTRGVYATQNPIFSESFVMEGVDDVELIRVTLYDKDVNSACFVGSADIPLGGPGRLVGSRWLTLETGASADQTRPELHLVWQFSQVEAGEQSAQFMLKDGTKASSSLTSSRGGMAPPKANAPSTVTSIPVTNVSATSSSWVTGGTKRMPTPPPMPIDAVTASEQIIQEAITTAVNKSKGAEYSSVPLPTQPISNPPSTSEIINPNDVGHLEQHTPQQLLLQKMGEKLLEVTHTLEGFMQNVASRFDGFEQRMTDLEAVFHMQREKQSAAANSPLKNNQSSYHPSPTKMLPPDSRFSIRPDREKEDPVQQGKQLFYSSVPETATTTTAAGIGKNAPGSIIPVEPDAQSAIKNILAAPTQMCPEDEKLMVSYSYKNVNLPPSRSYASPSLAYNEFHKEPVAKDPSLLARRVDASSLSVQYGSQLASKPNY